jgi:hypothetical protein
LEKGGNELIKISDIAESTPYTVEYLSLRARQGKLPAKKIDNVWYTTLPAVNEYRVKQEVKKDPHLLANSLLASTRPDQPASRQQTSLPWLVKWIAMPLAIIILIGFLPIQALYKSILFSLGFLNDLSDQTNQTITQDINNYQNKAFDRQPSVIHNFFVYSQTMLLGLGNRLGESLTGFYETHPTILAASRSDFQALAETLSNRYQIGGETVLKRVAERLIEIQNGSRQGQVAGAKSNADQFLYRTIWLDGEEGLVNLEKGEQSVLLITAYAFRHFSVLESQLIGDYELKLTKLTKHSYELVLNRPAEEAVNIIWRGRI